MLIKVTCTSYWAVCANFSVKSTSVFYLRKIQHGKIQICEANKVERYF